jgi:hypothetical protein
MKKLLTSQFVILLLGTLFAWGNFLYELWLALGRYKPLAAGAISCSAGGSNLFLKPCFFGALFFTIAFVLSAVILKKYKK